MKHNLFFTFFFFLFLISPLQGIAQWVNLSTNQSRTSSNHQFDFGLSNPMGKFQSEGLQDSAISYFNSSLPTVNWLSGGNYGVVIPIFGERITLSQANGFVDSVTIMIDSAIADTIFIAYSR